MDCYGSNEPRNDDKLVCNTPSQNNGLPRRYTARNDVKPVVSRQVITFTPSEAKRSTEKRILMKQGYVYILFNKKRGTLYVGVTSNLIKRIYAHKCKFVDGFTKKYSIDKLGYYEVTDTMYAAIAREKQLKSGSRQKKIDLIENMNPEWKDLYSDIIR